MYDLSTPTGTKSGSSARFLVLLTILASVSRTARLEDQLGLDDSSTTKRTRKSPTATQRAAQLAIV